MYGESSVSVDNIYLYICIYMVIYYPHKMKIHHTWRIYDYGIYNDSVIYIYIYIYITGLITGLYNTYFMYKVYRRLQDNSPRDNSPKNWIFFLIDNLT